MFQGDDEFNFTPGEAERVARAEGRTLRHFRPAIVTHPHHGGRGGMLLGVLLAGVLVVGFLESLKVSDADSHRAAASETVRTPAPHPSAPQIDGRPQTDQPRNSPTPIPTNTGAQDSREPTPPQNLLPAGWDRATYTLDTVLHANPWPGAAAVRPIPAGTELLVRIPPTAGFCTNAPPPQGMRRYEWHAAILASGRGWGYVCVAFSESYDEDIRREAPLGWTRSVYRGDAPALLQYPNGRILPGTEVIMCASGNRPDEFFVMSADGLSWGFGVFQTDEPPVDAPPDYASEEVAEHRAALPPDWERVVLGADTVLREAPQCASRVVATLPRGTVVLVKHAFGSWYGAVTENAESWGSICLSMSQHEPVRLALGDWTYERFPSGRVALVRKVPGGLVLYILADGSGWGKTSPGVL